MPSNLISVFPLSLNVGIEITFSATAFLSLNITSQLSTVIFTPLMFGQYISLFTSPDANVTVFPSPERSPLSIVPASKTRSVPSVIFPLKVMRLPASVTDFALLNVTSFSITSSSSPSYVIVYFVEEEFCSSIYSSASLNVQRFTEFSPSETVKSAVGKGP